MLLRLRPGLPGFSREDWQSTIRGYAAAHPDYSDMVAWVGRETADITYSDVDGAFTRLLIDKGYLASETWAYARPHYFIEVKTTTGSCSTPFFMSKYQYRRVGAISTQYPRAFYAGTELICQRCNITPTTTTTTLRRCMWYSAFSISATTTSD